MRCDGPTRRAADNAAMSVPASRAWWLPAGADPDASLLLASRVLRGFADGFVAVLLPAYLAAQGFGVVQIGVLGTLTLAGSAAATLAIGAAAHRVASSRLMFLAALTMV